MLQSVKKKLVRLPGPSHAPRTPLMTVCSGTGNGSTKPTSPGRSCLRLTAANILRRVAAARLTARPPAPLPQNRSLLLLPLPDRRQQRGELLLRSRRVGRQGLRRVGRLRLLPV